MIRKDHFYTLVIVARTHRLLGSALRRIRYGIKDHGETFTSETLVFHKSSKINKIIKYKNKIYNGEVDSVASRINAETRSLLVRIKIINDNSELIPGALLEVTIRYNERNDP